MGYGWDMDGIWMGYGWDMPEEQRWMVFFPPGVLSSCFHTGIGAFPHQ
jgi:hypothetical protein